MKKLVVLVTLLAFVLTGGVVLAAGAKVCCKDGKVVMAKDAAACTKAGGKMVDKAKCVPMKKK